MKPERSPKNPKGAGRPCVCCKHPRLADIDRRIVSGAEITEISREFAVTPDAVSRHKAKHLPVAAIAAGAEAIAEAEGTRGSGLLEDVSSLRQKAMELLAKAEAEGDIRTALMGVREAIRCVELMAKLAGQIDQSATINVTYAPQFLFMQKTIIQALSRHPEALRAVQGAFIQLEGAIE